MSRRSAEIEMDTIQHVACLYGVIDETQSDLVACAQLRHRFHDFVAIQRGLLILCIAN